MLWDKTSEEVFEGNMKKIQAGAASSIDLSTNLHKSRQSSRGIGHVRAKVAKVAEAFDTIGQKGPKVVVVCHTFGPLWPE